MKTNGIPPGRDSWNCHANQRSHALNQSFASIPRGSLSRRARPIWYRFGRWDQNGAPIWLSWPCAAGHDRGGRDIFVLKKIRPSPVILGARARQKHDFGKVTNRARRPAITGQYRRLVTSGAHIADHASRRCAPVRQKNTSIKAYSPVFCRSARTRVAGCDRSVRATSLSACQVRRAHDHVAVKNTVLQFLNFPRQAGAHPHDQPLMV